MRALTQTETQKIAGSGFIPGFATDDFFVYSALFGLTYALVFGVYARSFYPEDPELQPLTSFQVARCAVMTGIKYSMVGAIIDASYYLCSGALNATR